MLFCLVILATLFFPCRAYSKFLAQPEEEVASALYEAGQLLSGDGSRITKIEKRISSTYASLPKTSSGHLPPQGVRFIMGKYFFREHGWHLDLENHNETTQDTGAALLARMVDEGLAGGTGSFKDIVMIILTIERLAVHDTMDRLTYAYGLNRESAISQPFTIERSLNLHQALDVLYSYLIIFRNSDSEPEHDIEAHEYSKRVVSTVPHWIAFIADALQNFVYSRREKNNPFKAQLLSFSDITEVAQSMTEQYGNWQNNDCLELRNLLLAHDHVGFGRIPLPAFYRSSQADVYEFNESPAYLKAIGALEEQHDHVPQVRIANYVLGTHNCISRTSHYAVCCISECESLMVELENEIKAPTASSVLLLQLVSNMSSSTVEAPRDLPAEVTEKMKIIAERHHDAVPLHGRLFQQWMHFAFPLECPYPFKLVNRQHTAMRIQFEDYVATESEMLSWAGMPVLPGNGSQELDDVMATWIDLEEIPVFVATEETQLPYWSVAIKLALPLLIARFLYSFNHDEETMVLKQKNDAYVV